MCKDSSIQTPFARLEHQLIENVNGEEHIINAVTAILNGSKTENGLFNPDFLKCMENSFILMQKDLATDEKTKKKITEECNSFKIDPSLNEDALLLFLKEQMIHFSLLRNNNSTEIADIASMTKTIIFGHLIVNSVEYELIFPLIADHTLSIFNEFCLSVLKAEYLYDENLSVKKIEKLRSMIQNRLFRTVGQERTVVIAYAGVDLDYYSYNIMQLCDLYLAFNKRIDNLIGSETRTTIYSREGYETTSYFNYYKTREAIRVDPQNLLNLNFLSDIFPYTFSKILDVTYIDHNFCIAEEEIRRLVSARNTIDKVRELLTVPIIDVMSKLNQNILNETLRILNLAKFKVDFLLYKILDSEKLNTKRPYYPKQLKNYTIIIDETAFLFENTRKKYSDYQHINFIKQDHILNRYIETGNKNVLLDEFTCFSELLYDKTKGDWHISDSLVEYEKSIINSIRFINHKEKTENYSSHILDNYIRHNRAFDRDFTEPSYKDISSYNKMIYTHTGDTFVRCSNIIADIKAVKDESIDKKIIMFRNIQAFLKKHKTYSCSFIRTSISFIIGLVTELSEQKQFKLSTDDLKCTIDKLFISFFKLIKDMDNSSYISNFASLYQDSFYKITWENNCNDSFKSIERVNFSSEGLNDESINELHQQVYNRCNTDSETIFFASTWIEPIGKDALEQTYDYLTKQRETAFTKYVDAFQNFEHDKKIDLLDKSFQRKLDESKKDTVQTLGILAAFLALASSSIAGFSACQTPLQYCIVICCVTSCVLSFASVLKLSDEHKKCILFAIIGLLIFAGIVAYFTCY